LNIDLSLPERIEQTNLTSTEEMIIEKITKNINDLAFYNGAQMAEACGVSASLITRLTQKLGYNSFQEFKRDVEDLYKQSTTPYDTFKKYLTKIAEYESDSIHYSIMQDLQNITEMEKQLKKSDIDEIVAKIKNANTVYLVAMFASENAAKLLSHYLDRLEINYRLLFGLGLSKQTEYRNPKTGDLLIAFSSQGILKEVLEAVQLSKKNGATVVSVTDSKINSLAKNSDYVLVAPVSGATFDYSHTATVAMVNILANCLASTFDQEYLVERLEEVRTRWKERNLFVSNR